MKLIIEIPKEFVCDYEADGFEDCFQRFICDSKTGLMAGNYERETAEMLIKAFKDAKEVVSCKDCKHEASFWGQILKDDSVWVTCNCHGIATFSDNFCSWGERKDGDQG